MMSNLTTFKRGTLTDRCRIINLIDYYWEGLMMPYLLADAGDSIEMTKSSKATEFVDDGSRLMNRWRQLPA
jgi:hypothetical protein